MLRSLCLLLSLSMGAQYAAPGVFTMGTINQATLPPGWSQLEEFIFHPDQFHTEDVPKGLDRNAVTKFVEARVDRLTQFRALLQAEKVIDLYDLQEVCAHLLSLPAKIENSPDVVSRSTVIVRTVALVCPPADMSHAAEYGKGLVGRASTLAEFQELILLNDALGPQSDPKQLRSRMEQKLKELGAKRQTDFQAQLEYSKLEDTLNIRLERSEKANALKLKIIGIAERPTRIREEVKMYLTIQYGYLEFLQTWAARRLRRETWADQPSQQIVRVENAHLRQDVVKTFRLVLESLGRFKEIPKESFDSFQIRCLRGIQYFGGEISNSEAQFVEQKAGNQMDLLSK